MLTEKFEPSRNCDYRITHELIFGAYILSLTGRFAGCRSPILAAMRSPKRGFFQSWAVVLRSCRQTRARDCRLSS